MKSRGVLAIALLLAFALVAASCDSGAAPTTTTTTSVPTTAATTTTVPDAGPTHPTGGEVISGTDQEPTTLNPWAPGGGGLITTFIGQAYWTGVQDINGHTGELEPDVVTELPTIANGGIVLNADGTVTVRYRIRNEAVWADGTPISGDDFRFTYDTIMNPEYPIDKTVYDTIVPASIRVGPKTFEFTLAQPTIDVEQLFGLILPKHDVEGSDFLADWNDQPWVSGGPFMFERWQRGDFITLVRNPNYWRIDPETDQQLPYLDRVTFRFFDEAQNLVAAFEQGEVDHINVDSRVLSEALGALRDLEDDGVAIDVVRGPVWEHLTFSFSENSLIRNPRSYNAHLNYRLAVAHAIDKQRIADAYGHHAAIDSFVDAYRPALSQGAWEQYDYNPERARQYLAALCAEPGVDCTARPPTAVFTANSRRVEIEGLALLLEEMLGEVGIGFKAELEPSTLFLGETLDFGGWDLGSWFWTGGPGYGDLLVFAENFSANAPPLGLNIYRYGTRAVAGQQEAGYYQGFNQGPGLVNDEHSARLAELQHLANFTMDTTEIDGYLQEMERILADQVVFIPLVIRLDPGAIWANRIGNYKHNPMPAGFRWLTQGGDTWNLAFWYRADR